MRKTAMIFVVLCLLLSGCSQVDSTAVSILEFNCSGTRTETKTLYINDDLDSVTLNGYLELKRGMAVVQVTNALGTDVLWESSYSESTDFQIVLYELEADSELLLTVQSLQTERMKLTVTSETKLARDQEEPEAKEKPEPPDQAH